MSPCCGGHILTSRGEHSSKRAFTSPTFEKKKKTPESLLNHAKIATKHMATLGTNQGNKNLKYNLETTRMKSFGSPKIVQLPTPPTRCFFLCMFNVFGYPKEHQTQSSPLQWRLKVSEARQELVAPRWVMKNFQFWSATTPLNALFKNGPKKMQSQKMTFKCFTIGCLFACLVG